MVLSRIGFNPTFLEKENYKACRVVAYADNVALMVKVKFLDTVYELTQAYLNVAASWAVRSSLDASPELVLLFLEDKYQSLGSSRCTSPKFDFIYGVMYALR